MKRFKFWLRAKILAFLGLDVRIREMEKDIMAVIEKQLIFEEEYPLKLEEPEE